MDLQGVPVHENDEVVGVDVHFLVVQMNLELPWQEVVFQKLDQTKVTKNAIKVMSLVLLIEVNCISERVLLLQAVTNQVGIYGILVLEAGKTVNHAVF